jgi:hypothetical protein
VDPICGAGIQPDHGMATLLVLRSCLENGSVSRFHGSMLFSGLPGLLLRARPK